ncbi:short-subunit dehydrogenase [Rheinheimera pacifica]|uniref:SDR family NAD(P)-dependent oxidoreductase n=1 Tax=Rheinheimera pacifica TaxID=173990 RepID=UPI002855B296|nr:SDR family NAD(P)-dependent oxidoreductase [Rheinheimera pacifica]MDR6981815.1 short-subunit dehydrogenase [Rheinheimera pacifica]
MAQHILITGASSGIGRALAIKLAAAGYRLSLCGRSSDKLAQTQALLGADTAVFARAFCLNGPDADRQITEFCAAAQAENGAVDMLINCAGANTARHSADQPHWQELQQMMQLNFYAPVNFIAQLVPQMRIRGSGVVLNVLSTVCLFANANLASYSASKTALDSYSKVLRKELHNSGVKVLSLYPGGVNTAFRANANPDYLSADEVADAAISMLLTTPKVHLHELVVRPQSEQNFC